MTCLLNEVETSQRTRLKVTTLRTWRTTHPERIPFVKLGSRVLYREEDIESFITKGLVGGQHEH